MGLRIIYGEAGTGKSEFCFSEISKIIDTEEKIIVITPEQFSFTAERKLMDAVKTKAVLNAEVITLSRMAHRVLQEVGGSKKTNLSKCGKAMLVYSILNAHKKDLQCLGKTDENIDLLMTAITEFKQHSITVDKLQEEIEKVDDTYLQTKLKDLELIYSNFENHIKDNYIDETDRITILANELENTNIVENAVIYIDEFAGFTTQEYQVIKELVRLAKQVSITVCADKIEGITYPDTDVFYSNKNTMQKLIRLTKENGLELEPTIYLENKYRFKTEELKHLEKNISKIKIDKYENNVQNVGLFLAKNQYNEIENVAKSINNLVKNHGYRYKDISIITNNLDMYSSLIKGIFARNQIPVFIDEKRELSQNVIVQYVLSILELLAKNFSHESFFNYLKLGFIDYEQEEIFKLENYCVKWGISRNKLKEEFVKEKENLPQEIERLETIRKEVVTPLVNLRNNIMEQKTAKTISTLLYNFLQEQNIEEKIITKIKKLEDMSLLDLGQEYKTSYENILEILDQIVLIFGDKKLTLDNYSQIFKIGLKNSGLGRIPGTQDQVIVGDVERSRSHKVKAVYIIGLNDGSFPSVNRAEGFLGDEDRELLKQDGLELAKGTLENLYEENFNIYKVFSTAEEKLYLSYSSADTEGNNLRPSIYISKIKKMFPKLEEESDVTKHEELNEQLNYTNIPENIQKEKIDKLYGNILKTSVTRLESYKKCAYSYFLRYGLKVKEKEELKVHNFDTGSFMHEVVDEFFHEVVFENRENLKELTDEDIEKYVDEIIERKLKLPQSYIFTATAKYRMLVKRLKRTISQALKYIIESLVYSDFDVKDTEVEFDQKILELEDGKKVEITGKIDRIDTAKTEDGNYLRIIDYKSSVTDINLNKVYDGLQIQLLTYMDVACDDGEFEAAGAYYFGLIEKIVGVDNKISKEEIENRMRKEFQMKGLVLADVNVIKMQDHTAESGKSTYIPPLTITKSGELKKGTKCGVDSKEFKILQEYIPIVIKQIAKEILGGNIKFEPLKEGQTIQCNYCPYKSICGFDTKLKGNKYKYVSNLPKEKVFENMKVEEEK